MSVSVSKTCSIGDVRALDGLTEYLYPVRAETMLPALLVSGDEKYVVCNCEGGQVGIMVKPTYDNTIPLAWSLDSIDFYLRTATGYAANGNYALTLRLRGRTDDNTSRVFGPTADVLSFAEQFEFNNSQYVKDDLFQTCLATFTTLNGAAMTAADAPLFIGTLYPTNAVPSGQMAFDYGYVVFNFSSDVTDLSVSNLLVYETTPYATKVRVTAVNVDEQFNSSYPLTCWFEWTEVDPTGAVEDTVPLKTTPEQTFTATRNVADRNLAIYDTLPSPLNVQDVSGRLAPNTTYWVRGVASLNGEETRSGWTSFTTPKYDSVVL